MSLPDTYLTYPKRAHGMDQDRHGWRPLPQRPPVRLSGRQMLACMIVVPLEFFMLNPSGKPFRHPGAMVTPYPDLRHYTTRDYGNRVGVFRLLDALKAAGLTATFAVNAVLLERVRPLIEAILADGHEIAAHGLSTDAIAWGGIDPAVEAAHVARTRELFDAAALAPRTWLSPARQQSFATPDLIRAAGFDVCLDWETDSVPISLRTDHGPLACVPLSGELDDRKLLIEQRQSEDEWAAQIGEAARLMLDEAPAVGAQVLSCTLTPYISGLPFRIGHVEQVLAALGADRRIWSAGAAAIADAFGPAA
jgi:allantoinase